MKNLFAIMLFLGVCMGFAQKSSAPVTTTEVTHNYKVNIPVFAITDPTMEPVENRTNGEHPEFDLIRNLGNMNILGVKFAFWKLFQPMRITYLDGDLGKIETKSDLYP